MALFSRTKKAEKPDAVEPNSAPVLRSLGVAGGLAHVLKSPRITEKATMHSGAGVYTFDIAEGATKRDVLLAVRALYKVSPRKVNIVSVPSKEKRNMRTGKYGMTGGGKKAYVWAAKKHRSS